MSDPVAPPVTDSTATASTTAEGSVDTVMIVLSYLGILALIPFFIKKDDPFVHWHAKQGLVLAVVSIALVIVGTIAVIALASVLGSIASIIGLVLNLAVLLLFILGIVAMIKGIGGQRWEIPVIGGFISKVPNV